MTTAFLLGLIVGAAVIIPLGILHFIRVKRQQDAADNLDGYIFSDFERSIHSGCDVLTRAREYEGR